MSRVLSITAVLASGALVACAGVPPWKAPADLDVLVYQTQAAFMCDRCEGLEITLAADGRMWVVRSGRVSRDTFWRKRKFVQLTPEQAQLVWTLLEPYRPAAGAPSFGPACEERFPDQGGVNISWRTGGVEKTIGYSGCDPDLHGELRRRINSVPALLGLSGGPFA